MLPKLAGRYLAVPSSWEVGEYNNKPIFEVVFKLTQFADVGGWEGVPEGMSITKRFFLKKNNGDWSEHTINALVDSLGWDGVSLKSLASGDWAQTEVQLEIDYEKSKDDKEYIGVRFMNPRDYQGKHLASDPGIVQSLDAKYGAELRAMRAGQQKSKAAPTPAKPVDHKAAAWAEFKKITAAMTDVDRAAAWKDTVKGYSGKEVKDVTDWAHVANSIAESGVYESQPSAGPGIPADDIPFIPNK